MSSPLPEKSRLRRYRWILAGLSLVFLVAKATVAWRTVGTDDALFWQTFARTVRRVGPIEIYSERLIITYNHPPPIGWALAVLNQLTDLGLPFRFLIRLPACLADVGSTFLVFAILRRRASLERALAGAVVVAVSPVLFFISGFHGNTDSVFVFFLVLSAWLLVDRDRPVLAGLMVAAALGVKLVPVVAVPALLAAAFRGGTGKGFKFGATAAVVVLASWLPAVVQQYAVMKKNVFGYPGHSGDWGITAILRGLGADDLWHTYAGSARFVVLLLVAVPAAYWAWRRPGDLPSAVGLALVSFLALSPAFASQYLAWTVVGLALLSPVAGAVYSLVAGFDIFVRYTEWNHGFPWDFAHAAPATTTIVRLNFVTWLVLLGCLAVALRGFLDGVRPEAAGEHRHDPVAEARHPVAGQAL